MITQPAPTARSAVEGHAPEPAASSRLASLDAFRGFTMFWIVGGKSLLMALQRLGSNAIIGTIAYELDHSPWEGLRFYDVIWPAFMLMVGVSIPLSYAKRRRTETDRQIRVQALKRAVVLFLLGSLRTSVSSNSPTLIELSSALQPIALAYLVTSLLAGASRKVQAGVGVLILVLYALALQFVPAPGLPDSGLPDSGLAAGSYEKGANLVRAVDLMVLGRVHQEGWGTVLSAIPTISTTILGLLIGQLLMSGRPARSKLKIIGLVGLGGVALGLILSPVIPVIMKLWTTSYGIMSAGCACLEFLVFYWIIDILGFRKWAFPFVIIGMNAIAIYLGVTLVPIHRIVGVFAKPVAAHLGSFGALFSAAAVLLVEWLILFWMYRRKVFIRA